MVYFSCSGCNESLKKPKVAKHLSFCRRCHMLTCLDCQKDFTPQSYVTHNQCVTELEKYSGRNYVEPANANKGQKKQLSWMDSVRAAVAEYPKQHPLNSRERHHVNDLLSSLLRFDNIPRKKAKFENFVKSAIGQFRRDQAAIDGAWAAISAPPPPQEQVVESAAIAKNGKIDEEEVEEENEKENEENEEITEPKKKKKKKKKKKRKEDSEEEVDEELTEPKHKGKKAVNGAQGPEEGQEAPVNEEEPKERKKRKKEKEKEDSEEEAEEQPEKPKKKKRRKDENGVQRSEEGQEVSEGEEETKEKTKEGKTEEAEAEAKEQEAGGAHEEEAADSKFVLLAFIANLLQHKGSSGISFPKLEKRAVRAYVRGFARQNKEPRPERVKRKLKVVVAKHFRQIDGRVFERESS